MSCIEGVSVLLSKINVEFAKDELVSSLFLDIEGAYVNVVHTILNQKMTEIDIPESYMNYH